MKHTLTLLLLVLVCGWLAWANLHYSDYGRYMENVSRTARAMRSLPAVVNFIESQSTSRKQQGKKVMEQMPDGSLKIGEDGNITLLGKKAIFEINHAEIKA